MNDLIQLDNSTGQVPDYMRQVDRALTDSTALQRVAITHVQDIMQGSVTITDATGPFPTLMGVSAANVSALALGQVSQLRRRYPMLASNAQELYPFMSDADYVGRFAMPLTQKVKLLVDIGELSNSAIRQPDGSSRLVVPRYTNVTVDDVTFTLLFPVVITERAYGGWGAHYDLSIPTPLMNLTSSTIITTVREIGSGADSIMELNLDMVQVTASVNTFDLNPSTGFDRVIPVGNFCYAQVWWQGRNATRWTEMSTTHDKMVYDANTPTAVLSVYGDGTMRVRVPQVYFTTGQISGKLRIDIFDTKGSVFLTTIDMEMNDFVSDFQGDGMRASTAEESAFKKIPNKLMYFSATVNGGRDGLSFEELKARVIGNSTGALNKPITPTQLINSIENDGYTVSQFVDNVTTRDLWASKELPPSKDPALITPGSTTMGNVIGAMGDYKASPWVANNGDRITIAPSALWRVNSGVVQLCPAQELTELFAMEPDTRVLAINSRNYVFSPFYYVLDASGDKFDVRPYHLDTPKSVVYRFLGENDTTQMQVEVKQLVITNSGNGWRLMVATSSNDEWKSQDDSYKMAQLNFSPSEIGGLAAINGEYMGVDDEGDDVFSFTLMSGYDIDSNNMVGLFGWHAITNDPREVKAALEQAFRLSFISGAPMAGTAQATQLDTQVVTSDLPNRYRVICAQELLCTLGVHLKYLWSACRTLSAERRWQTYPADVPAVYDSSVYEINPDNGTILFYNTDGKPYTKLLHQAGDVIMADGEVVLAHRKGDIVYRGEFPVENNPETLLRQFSMIFLEGSYHFATDLSTTTYTNEMIDVLVGYITTGLVKFQERAIERTNVYFYPRVTLGTVTALVDNNAPAQIRADQSLIVRCGVHRRVFDNSKLRKEIERKTIQITYDFLNRDVISTSDLIDALRESYGSDVISISVSGLAGTDASVITLVNANERLSLKKRVTILESGEFTVREDFSVDFFEHSDA